MRPVLVPTSLLPGESFTVQDVRTPGGSTLFNYHTGFQITLIVFGNGRRYAGDHTGDYTAGDLVLIGPYLPHMWREQSSEAPHSIVINFEPDFLGEEFCVKPEARALQRLYSQASRGLRFTGETEARGGALIRQIKQQAGLSRLVSFLNLLETFALSAEAHPLASAHYSLDFASGEEDRLNVTFRYIAENLHTKIHRAELARRTGMSESALSRFFSARVGRSLPAYVNELRIGRACRMLMETNLSIAEIAEACGYGHSSHFNRRFMALKKVTPRDFRAEVRRA